MIECKPIPLGELKKGAWYVGRGGYANIGLWDGTEFVVIDYRCDPVSWKPRKWECRAEMKRVAYYNGEHLGFQPFLRVDEGIEQGLDFSQPGPMMPSALMFRGDA